MGEARMDTRRIGRLEVSVVGVGCNNFGRRVDQARTTEVVLAALDAGVNFFDTADVYGATLSEEYLGVALASRRDEAIIATKFGNAIDAARSGAKPDYVIRACEDSLRRLRTDHIDLYQLHTPDPTTPLSDTLGALQTLIDQGKVLEIGCSNFDTALLAEAHGLAVAGAPAFKSVQNRYSLLQRDDEAGVLPWCEQTGTAYLPFFPLAQGLLTGKYRRGAALPDGRVAQMDEARRAETLSDERLTIVEGLLAFAESKNHSLLELAIAATLAQPAIASCIAGATAPDQVRANAAAAGWVLSPDELATIDTIAPPPPK
jgi:aryl-alcohol dehydrogenase-like predicted oxidoreductase